MSSSRLPRQQPLTRVQPPSVAPAVAVAGDNRPLCSLRSASCLNDACSAAGSAERAAESHARGGRRGDEDDYEDEEEHRSKRARGGRSYGGPFPPLDSEERASLRAVLLECGTLAAVLAGAGGEVSDASPAAGVRSSGTPPLSLRALELCLPDVSLPDALPSTDDDLVGASAASAAPPPFASARSAVVRHHPRHPFVRDVLLRPRCMCARYASLATG